MNYTKKESRTLFKRIKIEIKKSLKKYKSRSLFFGVIYPDTRIERNSFKSSACCHWIDSKIHINLQFGCGPTENFGSYWENLKCKRRRNIFGINSKCLYGII